jgi:hypothetical protein
MKRAWWPWVALALILLGTAAIRLRLVDVPLDRDEGEYAYIGRLVLEGGAPYIDAYSMKMPGIYLLYALWLSAFGHTSAGVHAGLLVMNALSTVVVFLLARRLHDAVIATAAAAVFAVATLNPMLYGLAAYAEHFLLPAALLGCLAVVRAVESRRLALFGAAGALFGVAFVIKQTGGMLALFAAIYVLRSAWRERARPVTIAGRLVAFAVGSVVPFALVCLWAARTGSFGKFWFWTFEYATQYGMAQRMYGALVSLRFALMSIAPVAGPVLALAAAAIVAGWLTPKFRRGHDLLAPWLGVALVIACVGFYFRPHYFLLMLPPAAILVAAFARALVAIVAARSRAMAGVVAAALVLVTLVHPLVFDGDVLFRVSPAEASRMIYGRNPFVESLEVAQYIRAHAAKDDRIAVIGSEPQIYFYAGRPAATGYIYMYPLMEVQPFAARMQQELIRELEIARPRYLVYVNIHASWLATPHSDVTLSRWFQGYWRNFERVGVADIISGEHTSYVWDDAARTYTPRSPLWIAVLRRRT